MIDYQKIIDVFNERINNRNQIAWEYQSIDEIYQLSIRLLILFSCYDNIKNVSIDVTNDCSVFFTIMFADKSIYIEMFNNDLTVFVNIIKNNEIYKSLELTQSDNMSLLFNEF